MLCDEPSFSSTGIQDGNARINNRNVKNNKMLQFRVEMYVRWTKMLDHRTEMPGHRGGGGTGRSAGL